ncbi:hypothetical protein LEN26_009368 [Aphanomyces euteiches]|nr:hypothetical protein LEN26_009368 [Aphanomyces euteiches]
MGETEVKRGRRGLGWSEVEDMSLARAYVAVSHDPIVGNGQKSGAIWSRVHDEFKHLVPDTKRVSSSLPHRWSTLQRLVSKFAGYAKKVEDKHESGKRQEDQVSDAMSAFQAVEGKVFRHRDVWEYLRRESPKFFGIPSHEVATEQENSNLIVSLDTNMASSTQQNDRPMGTKRAKLEAKHVEIEHETSAAIVSSVNEQREVMKRIAESVQQMAETQKANIANETAKRANPEEMALFTININDLDEDAKEYILWARQRVRDSHK